jgi:hypothetical protein
MYLIYKKKKQKKKKNLYIVEKKNKLSRNSIEHNGYCSAGIGDCHLKGTIRVRMSLSTERFAFISNGLDAGVEQLTHIASFGT